jgi:hypothetical protein
MSSLEGIWNLSYQDSLSLPRRYKRVLCFATNSRGPRGEKYFEASVCMVEHANKHSLNVIDKILVFDLGMQKDHRKILESYDVVEVIDFPPDFMPYHDFYTPKHFAWKYAVTWFASLVSDSVLYMDSGKFPTSRLDRAFEVIEHDGFFLGTPAYSHAAGEDFRREWLDIKIGKGHHHVPVTQEFVATLQVTPRESDQPQSFAGIIGFRSCGPYYKDVVYEAFKLVQNRSVCGSDSVYQHTNDQALITLLAIRSGYKLLHMEVFRTNFGAGMPDQKRIISRQGEDILVFWRAHGDEVNKILENLHAC